MPTAVMGGVSREGGVRRRLYLCAPYHEAPRIERVAELLRSSPWLEVVSSWHSRPHESYESMNAAQRSAAAQRDLSELIASTTLLYFPSAPFKLPDGTWATPGMGGTHREVGIAQGLGREVWVLGAPQQIFDYLFVPMNHVALDKSTQGDVLGAMYRGEALA